MEAYLALCCLLCFSFDDGGPPAEGPDPSRSADSANINNAKLHIIHKLYNHYSIQHSTHAEHYTKTF